MIDDELDEMLARSDDKAEVFRALHIAVNATPLRHGVLLGIAVGLHH